jgi:hypothetical protein
MGVSQTRELGAIRDVQQLLSIGPNLTERDCLLLLKMAAPEVLWKALLDVQFRLCKASELPALARDERFNRARHVLEIGYGDGGLVGGLAPYFPEKPFVSCGLPTRWILGNRQKTKTYLARIGEELSAIPRKRFDFLILRVVVQKVSQLGLFVDTIKDYLTERGALLIIDASDRLLGWKPAIPALDELMGRLRVEQAKTGAGRTAAEKVHRRASLFDCRPVRNEDLPIVGRTEAERRDFYAYFLMLSEVMVRAYGPILDQIALVRDLDRWIAEPNGHAQFGISWVEPERRRAPSP